MRVLLLGAGGMLGRDLAAAAPGGVALDARPRAALDVTRPAALARALGEARPDVVLNAAAYTAVDRAEAEPALAFAANAGAVGVLGLLCAERGARVVHVSTDYVFDGLGRRPYREGDATGPTCVYGASKLAGERALALSGARSLVVRTQWLYGAHGRSFVRTMWERARRGDASRVVADQWGAPTATADLARAIWALVARGTEGVVHAANAGAATWYDVAARVYAAAGRAGGVTPCASAEYPTPARRPAYGVLDLGRLRGEGVEMRGWGEAVDGFVGGL